MEIDMRSGSQAKLDDIDAVLQAAVEQALQEENAGRLDGPELTVEVKRVGTRPAAMQPLTNPVVQRAMAATTACKAGSRSGRSVNALRPRTRSKRTSDCSRKRSNSPM